MSSNPPTPTKSSKVDKVESAFIPPVTMKLEPGGSTKQEKSRIELLEDKMDMIFNIMTEVKTGIKDVRDDLTYETSKNKEARKEITSIKTECQETLCSISGMYEDFKIQKNTISEEQEELRDELVGRMNNLGTSTSIGHQRMDKIEKTQTKILENIASQNIMLNASGNLPKNASCYNPLTNPDTSKYPLLKTVDPKHSFDKLNINLKGIELQNDELAAMEHFWNAINSAMMVTLKSNYLFPEYRSLSIHFNPEDILIPPKGHPYFVEITQAYTQFSRVIREFLLKQTTITKTNSPQAYRTLLTNKLQRDGFLLLWTITYRNSPQLGGYQRDLQSYVSSLQVIDGEEIT